MLDKRHMYECERVQETPLETRGRLRFAGRRGASVAAESAEEGAADVGCETVSGPADFEQPLARLPQP